LITRRQLIGSGLALSALGLGAHNTMARDVPGRPAARVTLLVVDERFAAARTLARSLAAPGIQRVALPRDVLDLWHRQLAPACRSGAQAIAGVTTERGFFLLRTLTAEYRLRVLSRTTHGALVSWLIGPK
jgi:hypothetical protein